MSKFKAKRLSLQLAAAAAAECGAIGAECGVRRIYYNIYTEIEIEIGDGRWELLLLQTADSALQRFTEDSDQLPSHIKVKVKVYPESLIQQKQAEFTKTQLD